MGSENAEVWGWALFAATLVSLGSTWLIFAVLSPLLQFRSLVIDPYYAVFPAVFITLGTCVAWRGQREYKRRPRARVQPRLLPGSSQ